MQKFDCFYYIVGESLTQGKEPGCITIECTTVMNLMNESEKFFAISALAYNSLLKRHGKNNDFIFVKIERKNYLNL
jgi:hypothetical protein